MSDQGKALPLSQGAKEKALQLLSFVADGRDPTVWTAQAMMAHECLTSLVATAAQFHQGEASADQVLGALLMAAAWIGKHGERAEAKPH